MHAGDVITSRSQRGAVLPLGMQLRRLHDGDVPGLLMVQSTCYGPDLVEPAEVFAQRLRHRAHCSLALEHDGVLCAYLAAYASQRGKVTPLNGAFESVAAPDTLYLHDMAVLPQWAGQGLAAQLLQAAWHTAVVAEKLRHSALVAVQGAQAYWARFGYQIVGLSDAAQRARLQAYGDDAVYMERALPVLQVD
jgi:ribosomal protein S18 acetylase RimI-like enzyme